MNQDLTSYCQIYQSYFDKSFCDQIIKNLKDVEWGLHRYYTPDGTYISTETDLSVSYNEIAQSEELHKATWHAVKYYQETLKFSWFDSWLGMTSIRFNKYDTNTNMMPHCDHIHSLFDGERKGVPVLSIVGVLNEDYEGGNFVMWENKIIELPQGSLMIFPSNFLYPHQVTPVTKGTRYSFVQWVW